MSPAIAGIEAVAASAAIAIIGKNFFMSELIGFNPALSITSNLKGSCNDGKVWG
ncbi:hypothetical protein PSP6_210364 [Paraburkholderia tropica]|nr:hypothetical protein PSP6_210364 [Paraburkholderia tropica]